jgi:type VI secretion system protein ImpC
MPKPFDFGGVNLSVGGDSEGARPSSEIPFCIVVLGDFSGRSHRGISDAKTIGKRRATLVDRDNFDEVLARFSAEIQLPLGEGESKLRFSDLDGFHPDQVFNHLGAFGKLREVRARLQDPSTFETTARELGIRSQDPEPADSRPSSTSRVVAPNAAKLASGSLLDEMVEQTESRISDNQPHRRAPDEVHEFAHRVAEKYKVNTPDPRQPEVVSVIDRALSGLMRAVLHSQDFQALEALWRATYLLVRQLETGSQLKLYLVDLSKEELVEDLSSGTDVDAAGAYRLLVERSVGTPGAEPWSLIVGGYSFGPGEADVAVLSKMARIAHLAGAPFLAAASPQVLGCSSLASSPHPREWSVTKDQAIRWAKLRNLPEAGSIGLALPRFLLRLPYGKKTSRIESFEFEELAEAPVHDDYLWGNPAFAVALLLGRSFSEEGWEMQGALAAEIDGLPLHVQTKDGESECKPCAEVLLTQDTAEQIVEEGLIPLVSVKNRDSVRVLRFQSIGRPPQGLAARWAR